MPPMQDIASVLKLVTNRTQLNLVHGTADAARKVELLRLRFH